MRQIQRTTISQRKAKTAEAVANRGVDADAPRGENEDQRKEEKKSIRGNPCTEIHSRKKHLVEGKIKVKARESVQV